MELVMNQSELLSSVNQQSRPTKTKNSKRKWREIEAIHDRYRLKQELRELGMSPEDELEFL
jgi:hypothetical protein